MVGFASLGVFAGLASIYYAVPELIVSGGFLLAGIGYFWLINHSWKVMRFLSRPINRRRGQNDRRRPFDSSYSGQERRSGVDRRGR